MCLCSYVKFDARDNNKTDTFTYRDVERSRSTRDQCEIKPMIQYTMIPNTLRCEEIRSGTQGSPRWIESKGEEGITLHHTGRMRSIKCVISDDSKRGREIHQTRDCE